MKKGDKFGRWTFVGESWLELRRNRNVKIGKFVCECGVERVCEMHSVKRGNSKSCGCLRKEEISKANTKHSLRNHALYGAWLATRQITTNHKNPDYKYYGALGIKVCDEWQEFQSFYDWAIANGWSKGLHLSRHDKEKDFTPENCYFANQAVIQSVGNTKMPNTNKSGYVGVCWDKPRCKWAAQIKINKKKYNIGRFDELNDAVEARILAEIELLGEQKTNFHY
jgi:hypothetical protein